jgi:mono/diheme cytochrome c family protein
MKTYRIKPRTIEFLVGILATLLIVVGVALYAWNEPARIQDAQAMQLATDLDGALTLYSQNCAVCHGAAGEGIGATPALDNPALSNTDAEVLAKIIARGLYESAMPAWSLEDGGPLSDYQIGQLVSLIQYGSWSAAQERVVNLGLAPMIPFTTEPDPVILESLVSLPEGEILANGITLYAAQCVACHGADGLGTSLAPALNDPDVRRRSLEELERIIRLGVSGTLMAGWEKTLENEQISALLELMMRWEEIPSGAIPSPEQPVLVTEESLALGSELYATSCANCHGPEGQGSQRAPSLNVRAYLAETPDPALQQIITLGVPQTAMPAWGDRLNEAQIQAIVGFIRSWEPTAPEVALPVRVRGPWWQANASVGQTPQLPSGGEVAPVQSQPENSTQSSAPSTQHPGNNASQNSPLAIRELPWYQTLDQRAIILGLSVAFLALSIVLIALRGLRRLEYMPDAQDIPTS